MISNGHVFFKIKKYVLITNVYDLHLLHSVVQGDNRVNGALCRTRDESWRRKTHLLLSY